MTDINDVSSTTPPTSRTASGAIQPVLYPVLRIMGHTILRTFLRKIAVHVEHPVPLEGPTIFASNHPNGLLDPLSVGFITRRPVHFLAKSGIFAVPVWGWFLRRCGVLPVRRRMDNPTDMSENDRTFEACYQVLADGGAIGIFPEGVSHVNPELKKLKTGAARIALEAEERYDFRLGVRLVPVGLTFPERSRFRSTLGIQVGKPISLEVYHERYSKEPQEVVREVTDLLEETMKTQMLHLDHLELASLLADVDAVYREDLIDMIRETGSPLGGTSDPTTVQRTSRSRKVTPTPRPTVSARMPAAARRRRVRLVLWPRARCATRPRRSPRTCWRRPRRIWFGSRASSM